VLQAAAYDLLRASTGFILDALHAGTRPPKVPTATARSIARTSISGVIAGVIARLEALLDAAPRAEIHRSPCSS
jgi:hypothetical protein